MLQYLWIGLGGFLGANARYLLQQWTAQQWGPEFPYGTLLANVSGSFVIAFFLTLVTGRLTVTPEVRLFITVGFLGDFGFFLTLVIIVTPQLCVLSATIGASPGYPDQTPSQAHSTSDSSP